MLITNHSWQDLILHLALCAYNHIVMIWDSNSNTQKAWLDRNSSLLVLRENASSHTASPSNPHYRPIPNPKVYNHCHPTDGAALTVTVEIHQSDWNPYTESPTNFGPHLLNFWRVQRPIRSTFAHLVTSASDVDQTASKLVSFFPAIVDAKPIAQREMNHTWLGYLRTANNILTWYPARDI